MESLGYADQYSPGIKTFPSKDQQDGTSEAAWSLKSKDVKDEACSDAGELGQRRRTDEEAQLGPSTLALRFIRDRHFFYRVNDRQKLDRDRWRLRMDGKTDRAGRRAS